MAMFRPGGHANDALDEEALAKVKLKERINAIKLSLSISSGVFNSLYPTLRKYKTIFERDFKDDTEFLADYLPSKLWRMNNLYSIINKDGDRIKFNMNFAQHRVYSAFLTHPRLIILKSRQQGISTFWLIFFFDEVLFNPDLTVGLMAQGREESETLLERVKLAWNTLDDNVKTVLGISKRKDNSSTFSFSNNSSIFIRTSFRSATLQGLHVSELGKIANKTPERAKETNTGTLQAIKGGLPVALESTAEGNNMFKTKWDVAYTHEGPLAPKDFMAVFLSWLDDPDCVTDVPQKQTNVHRDYFDKLEHELNRVITSEQRWFWIMQERELIDSADPTTNGIYQEYPATPEEAFAAVRDGTYYAKLYNKYVVDKKRVLDGLYDQGLYVDVVMDLGMNDKFSMGFWQTLHVNGVWEERLIHEYTNSGEGLATYTEYMFNKADELGWKIRRVYAPHDAKVRELGTGISREKRLKELGVTNVRVLPKIGVNAGIEAVRRMIPDLWIDSSCTYIISCLQNYTKEWDSHTGNWKDKPLHDDFSHGADMVRYRAASLRQYIRRPKKGDSSNSKTKRGVVDGLCL